MEIGIRQAIKKGKVCDHTWYFWSRKSLYVVQKETIIGFWWETLTKVMTEIYKTSTDMIFYAFWCVYKQIVEE